MPRPASSRNAARTAVTGSSGSCKRRLRHSHQVRKGRRIRYGEIRQHFAVDLAAGFPQPVHQAAVGDLVLPSGRVDPDDPEAAEVAFLDLPVAVRVDERLLDLELRHPVRLGFRAVVALGQGQGLRSPVLTFGSPFDAWHRFSFVSREPLAVSRGSGLRLTAYG